MSLVERAYDLAVFVGEIVSFIAISLVIPALLWKRLRRIAGWLLRITAYSWGTGVWLSCGINLGMLWGFGGLLIGLSPAGLVVTPAVMLWHGYFKEAGQLVLGVVIAMILYAWSTAWIARSHRDREPGLDELLRRFSTGE